MPMIRLPFPPTINQYHRHVMVRGRPQTLLSAEGRAYKRRIIGLVAGGQPTIEGDVSVSVVAWYPNKRRRDLDNLLKPLLDSLTLAGVWIDDSQVKDLRIRLGGYSKPGYVEVSIEPMEDINCASKVDE